MAGRILSVECFPSVRSVSGPRPVWLAYLDDVADWPRLVGDDDWRRLVDDHRRPFGLLTVSPDPADDLDAWWDFASYCVERELVLVDSWGANTTLLDDTFDFAALERSLADLPGSMPLTTWHDDDPLGDTVQVFLSDTGSDLREDIDAPGTDWVRIVVVIGDPQWLTTIRGILALAHPHEYEQTISIEADIANKREVLRRVIQLDGDLDELLTTISTTSFWDDDVEAPLRGADVARVLAGYLDGRISADHVAEWAGALELRGDIDYDDDTFEVISELAPPDSDRYPLTPERARATIAHIERPSP